MAANLTRNKDDITEVGKFMDECSKMKIKVLEPDVNESELNFTVNTEGNIRFGLGGIKGVGEGAVEAIIKERQKNGKFKSIFDLVERINLTACNRKALESLAYAGALDSLPDIQREQLFEINSKGENVLDSLIKYGNKYQLDMQQGQNSLFGDSMGMVQVAKPELPKAEAWSPLEKLNKEKELIGMYLSAHPLDTYEFILKRICTNTSTDLVDLTPLKGKNVIIGGMVTDCREGKSKAGNMYGIMKLIDYNGTYEIPLFGKDYIEFRNYLIKDMYLLIYAVVQQRGADRPYFKPNPDLPLELKIQRILPLPETPVDSLVKKITLTIPLVNVTPPFVQELKEQLLQNEGKIPLYFKLVDTDSQAMVRALSQNVHVTMSESLYKYIKNAELQEELFLTIND